MFSHAMKHAVAAALAVVLPAMANAATVVVPNSISVNGQYSFAHVISPGETVQFLFTVLDDLTIDSFSVAGTGTNGGSDIRDIAFGMMQPVTQHFSSVSAVGQAAAGFGFLTGGTFAMGDVFSVFFQDGITDDVGLTLSFETVAVAPVPLPAAGMMLAPVLLVGGAAALRRRKATRSKV